MNLTVFDLYKLLKDVLNRLANFLLEDIGNYKYLVNGDVTLPNVDDGAEFQNTLRSMKIMGFHDDEVTCECWRLEPWKYFFFSRSSNYKRCALVRQH